MSIIGCYNPLWQTISLINSIASNTKLTHIIFRVVVPC